MDVENRQIYRLVLVVPNQLCKLIYLQSLSLNEWLTDNHS